LLKKLRFCYILTILLSKYCTNLHPRQPISLQSQ
jgi:hypothetical protein